MLEDLAPQADARVRCKIATVKAQLEPHDAALLDQYLADQDSWSSHGLVRALDTRGIRLSVATVIRHRKGQCSCSRT